MKAAFDHAAFFMLIIYQNVFGAKFNCLISIENSGYEMARQKTK